MTKCPSCENGQVEAIDNGPQGMSVDRWNANYPKLKTVDCETCDGSGEVFDIPAACHSDDRRIEINFDAVDYFSQCSATEIAALIQSDWRGDYPADAVAQHFRETTTLKLFSHLDLIRDMGLRYTAGFECSVDEDAAIAWLEENRPDVWEQAQDAIAVEPEPETVWGETIDWGGNGDA